VEAFAGVLQGAGALAVAIGLFLALPLAWAVLALGALAVLGGTALEVAHRPRTVPGPPTMSREQQRLHSLADRAAHASGR
jgi:hypothetical protein